MERSKSLELGSTLVLVLGAVVIAAMIALSYLIFTDNLRERAGRTLEQDEREITVEQGILAIEQQIRTQLLGFARYNLGSEDFGSSFSFGTTLNRGDSPTLSVTPVVRPEDVSNLTSLENRDPFGAAKALVQLVDLTAVSKTASDGKQRLPDVQLTATPQIAVREIPVSQFTVYSAGDPFEIALTPFGGDAEVGRVFSRSNITVAANFQSSYPVVLRGQITFQNGASLSVSELDRSEGSVAISTDTTESNEFWKDARTRFDSKFITSDVLPVECAPLDQIYDGAGGLNFILLGMQCDLVVVARADKSNEYRVTITGKDGTSYNTQPDTFVAKSNQENPGQTLLAFDYKKLPKGFTGSVFLVAQDSAGAQIQNATVVIRGAQTLTGALSIVTPHPIVIAGDFNNTGDPPACSIITAQDVQAQPADWGNDTLGPP
jgi:hypothetical protein